MKNKVMLFLGVIYILMASSSGAAVLTVSNVAGGNADYNSIPAAYDAAADGDTILVMGSGDYYVGTDSRFLDIEKKVYLFGPGFFLSENQPSQANVASATISSKVSFKPGSEGSVIAGFKIHDIFIGTSNITVERNYIYSYSGQSPNFFYSISFADGLSGIIINRNYIKKGMAIGVHYSVQVTIANNVIGNNPIGNYGDIALNLRSELATAATVANNVFLGGGIEIPNSIFKNNIIMDANTTITGTGNSYLNNICAGTQLGTANGNQESVDMSTVFVDSGTTDGQYQLKTGSPALGAGYEGEDCGIFGGNSPYILSGLPPLPAIYYFNAPQEGSQTDGLPVSIKIKTND